jgi:4-hydroxy-3-polyprenylbenzoate decarboxylase
MRVIVGITGATGAALGVRVLEVLRSLDVETHLVLTKWGRATIKLETDRTPEEVERLAAASYRDDALASAIASGSFRVDGMLVMPCSAKTLAAISAGLAGTLLTRAADVAIKERTPLVLCVREVPLSAIHLENMLKLVRAGVTIMPPLPSFYLGPESVDELVDQIVVRALDQLGIEVPQAARWEGPRGGIRDAGSERARGAVAPRLLGERIT